MYFHTVVESEEAMNSLIFNHLGMCCPQYCQPKALLSHLHGKAI